MTPHPDYERHAAHRWTAPLTELRRALDEDAAQHPGAWVWRILPAGIVVALRRYGGACEVRISRAEAPRGHRDPWERDLATLSRELRLAGWHREDDRAAMGVAALYRCDERLLCECGAKKSENAMLFGDGDHCDACRMAGREGRG